MSRFEASTPSPTSPPVAAPIAAPQQLQRLRQRDQLETKQRARGEADGSSNRRIAVGAFNDNIALRISQDDACFVNRYFALGVQAPQFKQALVGIIMFVKNDCSEISHPALDLPKP